MSFLRLIYWSSLLGGWSAFVAWLFAEILFGRWIDPNASSNLIAAFLVVLMTAFVASAIAGGISLASAFTNPGLLPIVKRLAPALVGGFIGGFLGSVLSELLFACVGKYIFLAFIGRVIGLTLVGIGIGAIEGLYDRSWKKVRNGLVGGSIGGFLGGIFFLPISLLVGSISGRAFAFVLLGLSIGLFIGLVQVILKEAWLTVEGGFRPGRQVILTQDLVTMGTSEKASLIFIAFGAKGVEPIHLRITKQKDGGYLLEDNNSRTGTALNGTPIAGPTMLRDGDAIGFGVNVVRFNERVAQGSGASRPLPPASVPPPPKPTASAGAIQATPPAPKPAAVSAAPPKPPAPAPAIQPAPKPKPAPAEPPKPQEGRCPICDKKVVGIVGERRCKSCFTTF